MKVAALFVQERSAYSRLVGVECFTRRRDAATFDLSCPVIAHPPCRVFSKKCGHQVRDGVHVWEGLLGAWAIHCVRSCGGVLEHPYNSRLWNLLPAGVGFTAVVDQAWWGEPIIKRTRLWFVGVGRQEVEFPFSFEPSSSRRVWQTWGVGRRSRTCKEFAGWLVDQARKVERP